MSTAIALAEPPSPPAPTLAPPPIAWSAARRFAFRFLFAYVALYSFSLASNSEFGWDWLTLNKLWHALIPWLGKHVLHLPKAIDNFTNGSGDTLYDWLLDGFWACTALVAAMVWSVVDRRRTQYERLHAVLRLWVRYALAYQMLSYGFAKVFKLQFPLPAPSRLAETYGESSPMGILWAFMGVSTAYTVFGGLSEVLGGLLLLFRRTTTLGALVVMAVMTNVVMLNFCYDVPVKLLSSHLLLLGVWLLLPDAKRLVDVLILHRPTTPSLKLWRPASTRGVWARRIVKYGLLAFLGFQFIHGSIKAMKSYGDHAPKPKEFGAYEVEQFIRRGKLVEQRLDDPKRWRFVAIGLHGGAVRLVDGTLQQLGEAKDGQIEQWTDDPAHHFMSFAMPDAGHIVLSGKFVPFDNDEVKVTLKKIDETKLPLLSRGFHLVNEFPFNR
ncbi:MAG TPA: hypothetical protein VIA18_15405 [Polyangia bacterium]|jgi:uncharacterized membrane protein YphA (DoxX/SURF4 family)|nr:hypothetical protein [Polyangia bacterium]